MPSPTRVNIAVAEVWSGTTATTLAAPAQSHTSGNTLIVCTGCQQNFVGVASIADTAGNTYTKVDHALPPDNSYREEIWYAKNIIGHASNVVTVTWASFVAFRAVAVLQYSGLSPTAPFDATAKSSTNTNPVTTGTLTTTASNEIHLLLTRWGWTTAITWPSGFTIIPGLGTHIEIADALVAAPMSGTYAIDHAGAGSRLAFAAAFKPADAFASVTGATLASTAQLFAGSAAPEYALRATQFAVEVFYPLVTATRSTQYAVEVFYPILTATRATQQAVEYFQTQSAAIRTSQEAVEIFLQLSPPAVCPADFPIDPGSGEEG